MTEAVTPTVARRRVRLALREAREAKGLTQQQVADEMEWSLSKVIRIENGDVTIAPNDLRPLLGYYGIKDRDSVSELLTAAKVARMRQRQAWYQAQEYRDQLSDATRRLIEYEAEAVAIRAYSIYYLPGFLQIPQYAEALTGKFREDIGDDRVKVLLRARERRRQTLMARLDDVQVYVLLEQSVFMRPIGGPTVFAGQLKEMQTLATQDHIHLRMLPFDLDYPIPNNGSYDLVALSENRADSEVLYRENAMTDEIVEDKASTTRHRSRFEQLWNLSTNEADTIDFVDTRIKELETKSPTR
ncbi:helix-turn-helix domain-containing protein [Nucisporomicrobium flavum]|jgi:transcriptional regulator with XRE-family HTH domain|uniref:helix-turn-helix domain-containing protein n=1 Tax=Nucisporomicrobium flavum TaxID=2785915 RepID=UPI0018F67D56|nr:helix-turn-helix transcriptional regulator [Nucisporomicrobium flavum]